MKGSTGFIILLAVYFLACSLGQDSPKNLPESNTVYEKLTIDQIRPRGWIREFLERQRSGLTGNIEVAGYPFDTCMWACEKMEGSTKAWWPYEQTSYYIDGVHRMGLLLDDETLVDKARQNTRYVLDHITASGRFATQLSDRWWRWPYATFNRVFMTEYETTGNEAIVKALHQHYLTFTAEDFADDLELANVEQLCWLFQRTDDKKLLRMAERAYALFKSDIQNRNRAGSDIQFGSDRVPDHHGVVYLELLKVPALLYRVTGKAQYLEEALHGLEKMEKHHMLVSGLPSSTEHFDGISETAGHETCNTAVFPYVYGHLLRISGRAELGDRIERAAFNAGVGSITKDFKSHQYFSAPNQFLATMNSNPFGHHPARMAFLPGHDVECCTGNLNRFMPYFVEQMWLSAPENGVAAALLGPSSVTLNVGQNEDPVTIVEETNYPFSEEIHFRIQTAKDVQFPFLIRIPAWAEDPHILINNAPVEEAVQPGTFFKIERKFSNGDRVKLLLPMMVKTSHWPNQGIAVERGPLVFSLPIQGDQQIVKGYEKSTDEFPGRTFTAGSGWEYAFNPDQSSVEVIQAETGDYPWEIENTPIKLKVAARKMQAWKLHEYHDKRIQADIITTPAFPEKRELTGEVKTIELVPYGCTLLRLTVFPQVR